MQYRSISDMNSAILKNLHRLPRDLDVVVGVPRSGMLAANLLALMANLRMTDLESYLSGRVYSTGITKLSGMRPASPGPQKVLVLDDSISSGHAMRVAREKIRTAGCTDRVIYAAVYGSEGAHIDADLVFESLPHPRMFQWNFMHHEFVEYSCVDIDGVLCHDPIKVENDDGAEYLKFLAHARPLYVVSRPIHTLVTSRLEKYRPQTEAWLQAQGVKYGRLVMLDLPSQKERQRLGNHGSFKAEHYRNSDAILFIESEIEQARTIARLSGKPVLCIETHELIEPSFGDVLTAIRLQGNRNRGRYFVKQALRSILSPEGYEKLRQRLRRRT